MPPISFLDLVPKRPRATVVIEGEAGPAECSITGISLAHLAEISRKFPAFARVVEGGAGLLSVMEALPAIIAAGLGHHGDAQYERQAAELPPNMVIELASEVFKLTFGGPSIALAEAPAAPDASANGTLPEALSQPRLSN
jgi:hypothetical protein